MEGINNIYPVIAKIDFREKGNVRIFLEDGRIIVAPLRYFPSLKRMDSKNRKRYHIIDGQMLLFDHCDEIFHIEQFLGKEQKYRYHFDATIAAEPKSRYGKE